MCLMSLGPRLIAGPGLRRAGVSKGGWWRFSAHLEPRHSPFTSARGEKAFMQSRAEALSIK